MVCKNTILVFLVTFLLGCSTTAPKREAYIQAYQRSVKEHMHAVLNEFQGGQFPYYHWSSPIVQSVQVPGHISNGVFIPAHEELVIIKPGEWVKNPAYPIESRGQTHEKIPTGLDCSVADITPLPNPGP